MLKIQFKDKRQPGFWVMEKTFSIGKAKNSHLTLNDASVSEHHARIYNQGDAFSLKDLGSAAGTYVNDRRITQKNIYCGDIIKIGDVEMEVIDPLDEITTDEPSSQHYWSLIADSSWLSGQEFPIVGEVDQTISVGRSSQCDVVFPGTHLSRLHAEITINYSSLTIKDMGSANGTFVNDKKITSAQVYPGDRIRLDVYGFRIFGPGIQLPRSSTTSIDNMPSAESNDKDSADIKWQSKPTSPGNREQLNLYEKRHGQLIAVGIICLGLLGLVTYVALGLAGVI